ncbi:MAG: SPFH domain-containing protein [Gammaproteobacteria bacterium]|nr:SPFH domain-containing protein [Gammaproteobacteria bacterium]MCP5201114.1 SPFH domain-containing protein [Gammaproteobacteria bacterium]
MAGQVDERGAGALSGWLALPLWLGGVAVAAWSLIAPVALRGGDPAVAGILAVPVLAFLLKGFVVLEPNQAAVLVFFGKYAGSLRDDGFFWVNPFYAKHKLSLRAHNLNTPTLKVNDSAGNPIEVAAVIVWRVADTARATFDVENYYEYVTMQSESAVRQVVSARWYDGDENGANSLRGDLDMVARLLVDSIQSHCELAGLEILEARISHLAYAPEIAGAMLRRQQAVAVVAARTQIVEGAVGMVSLAMERLENEGVVRLDDVARVRLVTNLMTVLVGDSETQPVLSVDHD